MSCSPTRAMAPGEQVSQDKSTPTGMPIAPSLAFRPAESGLESVSEETEVHRMWAQLWGKESSTESLLFGCNVVHRPALQNSVSLQLEGEQPACSSPDNSLTMPYIDLDEAPDLRAGFFGQEEDRYILIRDEYSAFLRDVEKAPKRRRHFLLTGQPGIGEFLLSFA